MALRDFALLVLICLVWASNNIVSKIVVAHWGVPPIFYAAVRFAIVAAVTLPWLLPAPKPTWRIVAVALLMGGCNFALMFTGLQTASPSAAAIVLQMGVPITTILSMIMLGEQVRWRRGLGIAMTLAGALIVMWNPGGFTMSTGLLWILAATFAGSLGAVMMKQVEGVKPLRFQAWVGACSLPPLLVLTLLTEQDQWQTAQAAGWQFWLFVTYSALVVSVLVHTAYYALILKYEANLISPLTLMTPLATIGLGILITNDHFDMRMAIGAALALVGVLIIAIRGNSVMPRLLALWNRGT
ncbi:MAG TPA: DMT family transporter [Caulobacteraceae bacterium]|nr:DMT family transporter [Caulobacteraceae bacterium]